MQTVKKPGLSRAAALDVPSGFGGRYAETDESPQAFVPCGFCCPGAEREAIIREKLEKVVFCRFFGHAEAKSIALMRPKQAKEQWCEPICRFLRTDIRRYI